MPNIVNSKILSSDHELRTRIWREYEDAVAADYDNRERSYNIWKAYLAVDNGAAEAELLSQLTNERRHYESYNILGNKVDTLAGALSAEKFDLDLKTLEGPRHPLNDALLASWYGDKDLCRYKYVDNKAILNMLLHNNETKMVMSDEYDPRSNICFKVCQPGFVVRDPHWQSSDDRDCEKVWEVFHLNAAQIKQKYPDAKGPLLEQALMTYKRFGSDYDSYEYDFNTLLRMGFKGDLYRVVEYHWIENVVTTRLYGQKLGSVRYIPFPITKDRAVWEAFVIRNQIDPNTIYSAAYTDKIHKMAVVSDITENILTEGVARVQPRRLPYFHLTSSRALGKDVGIAEQLLDLQRTLNKRELRTNDMIENAMGGGVIVNRDLFPLPEERANFEQNMTNPAFVHWADGDEMKNAFIHLKDNNYNAQIVNQIERLWDVVDRISKVPAAMDAMSESSNESGVLYERKLAVSRLSLATLVGQIEEYRRNIFEAYYWQWQVAKEYNEREREFSSFDGKYKTVLNRRVWNEEEGRFYIENRPVYIPRAAVVISEAPDSPTKLLGQRALFSELFDRAVQTNPEQASIFFEGLMYTMKDDLPEPMKEKLKQVSFIQTVRDYKRIETEIKTLDATAQQAMLAKLQAEFGIQEMLGGGLPAGEQASFSIPEEEVPRPVSPGEETPQEFQLNLT